MAMLVYQKCIWALVGKSLEFSYTTVTTFHSIRGVPQKQHVYDFQKKKWQNSHTHANTKSPPKQKKTPKANAFFYRSVNISSSSCNIIMDSLWKMSLKPIKPPSPSRFSSFSSLHRSSYLPSKRWLACFFRGHLPKNEGEEMVELPTGG